MKFALKASLVVVVVTSSFGCAHTVKSAGFAARLPLGMSIESHPLEQRTNNAIFDGKALVGYISGVYAPMASTAEVLQVPPTNAVRRQIGDFDGYTWTETEGGKECVCRHSVQLGDAFWDMRVCASSSSQLARYVRVLDSFELIKFGPRPIVKPVQRWP